VVEKDDQLEKVVPASGHVLSDGCETVGLYGWARGSPDLSVAEGR
jgi:hypothetical protein